MKGKTSERLMQIVFFVAACTSVLAVALICVFLFANGIPAIAKDRCVRISCLARNGNRRIICTAFFPFILGSIYVTAGAIVIGVPLAHSAFRLSGIITARSGCIRYLKTMVNLMAGIPSVVYGFFGLVMILSR